jgi:SrtB family sortase
LIGTKIEEKLHKQVRAIVNIKLYLRTVVSTVAIGIVLLSAYQLKAINDNYRAEADTHQSLLKFRPIIIPATDDIHPEGPGFTGEETETHMPPTIQRVVHNQGIVDLQAINPDVVGWIHIDGTAIDYPFVQGEDNDFYLRRNVYKEDEYAGSIYLDYRCEKDFSGFNTILYGHQMRNGSMFHNLVLYANADFFNSHVTGTIFLVDQNFSLEIFAYMVVRFDDSQIYTVYRRDTSGEYLEHLRSRAQNWRDIPFSEEDRIVILSTCASSCPDSRVVVAARLSRQ